MELWRRDRYIHKRTFCVNFADNCVVFNLLDNNLDFMKQRGSLLLIEKRYMLRKMTVSWLLAS